MGMRVLAAIALTSVLLSCLGQSVETGSPTKTVFLNGDTTKVSNKGVNGSPVSRGEMSVCEFVTWMRENPNMNCCQEGVEYWTDINGTAYRIDTIIVFDDQGIGTLNYPDVNNCP